MKFDELLNSYRVFPRIALIWLLYVGWDSYHWAKLIIPEADVANFTNAIIAAIILGLFAYMNTGRK
jgi:hypothetical protein